MTRINPAHVNPPRETTPEEAERDKRDMTRNEAEQAERERARNEDDFREQGGSPVPDADGDKPMDRPAGIQSD